MYISLAQGFITNTSKENAWWNIDFTFPTFLLFGVASLHMAAVIDIMV